MSSSYLDENGGILGAKTLAPVHPSLRAEHLGPGWDKAYVRGTPFNTGEALEFSIQSGAAKQGDWSGCHSTCWDANAPKDAGNQILTNQYTKSGYPLGLMFNVEGNRFVDEGIDMRNFTYAVFGRKILEQPEGVAFQVWDADAAAWLRSEEYADDVVEKITADTVEELAVKLGGVGLLDLRAFVDNLSQYNAAVVSHRAENPEFVFDPSKKDGVSTLSKAGPHLSLDKTNWALPIVQAPFLAVKVTCGVTFTFGGLRIEPESAGVVAEETGHPIPGLFCAGEMLGGLFYGNYPGGSGLTSGSVFGRRAGKAAARRATTVK